MLFSEVIGHKKQKKVLCAAVASDRIGHAYIFEGPRGVGKLDVAKAFATAAVCENPDLGHPCGKCSGCHQCMSENHPDIQIVTNQLYDSTKKSTDILVDTIRSMKRDVYVKPYTSDRKIYIIPKADTMNMYAQNSLLKVLEEPPEYCTIILIAENSNLFLPTILSRANVIKFFPLSTDEMLEYLSKKHSYLDVEKQNMLARLSGGSYALADALSAPDSELDKIRLSLMNLLFSLYGTKRQSIYDMVHFLKQHKEETEYIMIALEEIFRDLLFVKMTDSVELSNADNHIKLSEFASMIPETAPQKMLESLFRCRDYLLKNISYALVSQCLCIELWEVINDRSYRS